MQDFDLKTTEQLMKLAIEESKQEQQEKELEIKRQTGTGI